jgi:hypothetical protein
METLKNLTLVQWIGIMVGLNSLLMGATPQLTVLFGTAAVPYIIAVATLGNGALGVFGVVVGGIGTQVSNVAALPGVDRIVVNRNAGVTLAAKAVDQNEPKIGGSSPETQAAIAVTAKAAG